MGNIRMEVTSKIRYQPKQGILGLANPSVITDRPSNKQTKTLLNLQTNTFLSDLRILKRSGIKTLRTQFYPYSNCVPTEIMKCFV